VDKLPEIPSNSQMTGTGSSKKMNDLIAAFEIPNFRLLWAGRVTSNMARSMRNFLRVWVVWETTNSPLRLGIVSASLAWPMLFMPFVGGFLADKLDQKRLLQFTEVGLAILWGVIAVLVFTGRIEWWHFIISGLLSGFIQSIGRPVHQAILGNIVDPKRLPNAVALDTAADTWPRAAGPALGGVLMGFIGLRWTFVLHVLGQVFTALTIFLLNWNPVNRLNQPASQGIGNQFFDGFRYVWNEPVLFGLIGLGVCFAMIGGSVHFLMPLFADLILGVGGSGLGFLMTASTLGASAGSLLVVLFSKFPFRGYLLLGVAILNTALLFSFSRSSVFLASLVIVMGMGMANVMFRSFRVVAMQVLTPNSIRGRVMSFQTSIQGMGWIGVLVMGSLAEVLSRSQGLNLRIVKLGGDPIQGGADTVLVSSIMYGLVSIGFFALVPALRRFK